MTTTKRSGSKATGTRARKATGTRARKPPNAPTPTPAPRCVWGVDVGLANTAAVRVCGTGDEHVLEMSYCLTKPTGEAHAQAQDDLRRLVVIIWWCVKLWAGGTRCPVRIEWYVPWKRSKRGWTTILVVGALAAVGVILKYDVGVHSPPFNSQVVTLPPGMWRGDPKGVVHLCDALTHARLLWLSRYGLGAGVVAHIPTQPNKSPTKPRAH